ncbi:hypothetical protein TrLO_g3365 [Triparma laevis f. longispina]|uniref:Uncharacterized protein n=1 Tax=Triparma laevis f. longispina TaxID=1714387 RepID=A0A9W7AP12_9STRA|nr:hypothetical protein TrLO_g3365 [Triparma laevis f. longispina]
MFDQNKSCDLLLHMNLEHQGDDEIIIKVSSASIDGEDASLPNLHPTAAKNFRLLLSSGTITLQRLPYGQTSFTFSTQLTLGEVKKKGISSSSSIRATVLGRISSKTLVESITSRAKRVAGTANESVEKYFHKPERGGAAVGMTVAKMDLSAIRLVAELWLLDTYAEKIDLSDRAIMEVWHNLDGTRGQQYATSIGLPGGFQDRLFKTWFTWEKTIDGGSRRTFIIALAPLKTRGHSRSISIFLCLQTCWTSLPNRR